MISPSPPRIVISINLAWNIYNFRAGLVRALIEAGYEVIALTPSDEYAPRLAELGCRFVPIKMDNGGTNPLKDAALFAAYRRRLREIQPDVYLGYTVKPNVYGSLAAQRLGIPVINNIAGLGTVFAGRSLVRGIVEWLYKTALTHSHRVFFQNDDDRQMFVERRIVAADKTALLPGSGVDLSRFAPAPLPATQEGDPVRFLFIARLLWDKGLGEYVEAARQLKTEGRNFTCAVLGFLDVENPTAVDRTTIEKWQAEGLIDYLGSTDDVRPHIAASDCVVLPSYYPEGTPRSLLEAAAMARPIITTDMPGCRNVVDHETSGYLCRPRDAWDLAEQMLRIVTLSPNNRSQMGNAGRKKMEREYSEKIVVNKYLVEIKYALR